MLDLIFVNDSIGTPTVNVPDGISDHKIVFMALGVFPNKSCPVSFIFSAADDEAVLDHLDLCLSDFKENQDVTLQWDKLKLIINTRINKYVPKKHKKIKRSNLWISRQIIHLKRGITRKGKARNTPTDVLYSLTARLKEEIRRSRNYFFGTTLVNFRT